MKRSRFDMAGSVRNALLLVMMGVVATAASAQGSCSAVPRDGARVLFAGHSFFVPIARAFDRIAAANGIASHSARFYFSGGESGSPASLLDDSNGSRRAIEAELARGADVLGLTVFPSIEQTDLAGIAGLLDPDDLLQLVDFADLPELFALLAAFEAGDFSNAQALFDIIDLPALVGLVDVEALSLLANDWISIDDYAAWIGIALGYNPHTSIFIASPWFPFAYLFADAADDYDALIELVDSVMMPIVIELRRLFPRTRVDYVNHGKMVSAMLGAFADGELPDVDCLVPGQACGPGGAPLFRDGNLGHAGEMMEALCALTWFETLYGVGVDALTFGDDESDASSLVRGVESYTASLPRPPQDWDRDGACAFFDVLGYLRDFDALSAAADLDGSGSLDRADIEMLTASSEPAG